MGYAYYYYGEHYSDVLLMFWLYCCTCTLFDYNGKVGNPIGKVLLPVRAVTIQFKFIYILR